MYTTLTQRGYQWIINGYVRHARIVNSILSAAVAITHMQVPVNRQMMNVLRRVHFFIVSYDIYYYSIKSQHSEKN